MTPKERTIVLLTELDDDISEFKTTQSDDVTKRIEYQLRWINSNLDVEQIKQLIRCNYFMHGAAIIKLLEEPYYNTKKMN